MTPSRRAAETAIAALRRARDLDTDMLHDGYDSGPGGGNFVYVDVVRTAELFPLLEAAIAEMERIK